MSEVSDEFEQAFLGGGGLRIDCGCGREFFADEHPGYDWGDGEHANLVVLAKKHPDKYVHLVGYDSVHYLNVLGRNWVQGCDCDYGPRVEALLTKHAEEVTRFLFTRARSELVSTLRADALASAARVMHEEHQRMLGEAHDAAERLMGEG